MTASRCTRARCRTLVHEAARIRRRLALGLLALLVSSGFAAANDQVPGAPQTRPVLLRGGDLYTISDGVLTATDLLFEDGRITRIGRGLEPPADAEVIDVTGQRVYPGLIAPQTAIGLIEIGAVRATDDRREIGSITPEAAAHTAYNPDSEIIPTVRSHGITTAQIVPGGALLRGRSFLTHLDGWTKEDAGVRLVDGLQLGWPAVRVRRSWRSRQTPEEQREALEQARRDLRRAFEQARAYHVARAADPQLEIDLRWEAMRPVFTRELPVYVSADDYRQIVEAVAFAEEFALRMILVGGREAGRLTDLLNEHGIPVIVANTTALPLRPDDDYDLPFRLPALLHEAGVKFCLADISDSGWSVRNLPFQAGQAVAFGLPADVALRALTLSTAEILGVDDLLGSLEVGKQATLFVSEGDVMDTLGQRVVRMWIEGRAVDLDDRHKTLYRKYQQKPARLP